jgi:hypothetical protein
MRKFALSVVVAASSMVVTTSLAKAEPVTLTASQMESVTAAALIEINIPILVQTNLTTQVANAIALAFATCGVCSGGALDASSLAAAINDNVSGQQIQR